VKRATFWARWAARDLRSRWVQVVVLGLVIAVGCGLYAGLTSTTAWRLDSLDASYEALAAHDVRVELADGAFLGEGELVTAARSVDGVVGARERLSVATRIEADPGDGDEPVLVAGRLVGTGALGSTGTDAIDELSTTAGRDLGPEDEGEPVALVQSGFAERNGLAPGIALELGGGTTLRSVGHAVTPEWFVVTSDQGTTHAESTFGALFTSLATAQDVAGRPDQVNDLVVRLDEGADAQQVGDAVVAAVAARAPDVGAIATPLDDDLAHRLLYDDARQDDKFFRVFAGVVLLGAAFGALNLSRRSVDRQRREIGIGLALGAPPRLLALRPLLGGLQVALVGVVVGMGVGVLVGNLMLGFVQDLLVLPVWEVGLDPVAYVQAAGLTIVLVMAGIAWPVARAVRVEPVDAIRTGHLARAGSRSRRGATWVRRALPVGTLTRMPFGNVVRARQRLVLTVLAIGATSSLLLMTSGMLTSFTATLDRADTILVQQSPERLTLGLAEPTLEGLPPTQAIAETDGVAATEDALQVPATAHGDDEVDLLLEVADLDSEIWSPVPPPSAAGLVLARKAADDLGVAIGDEVRLEHPTRRGTSYAIVETRLPVAAVHDLPLRPLAFLDRHDAALLGLDGVVNTIVVEPEDGQPRSDLRRTLFEVDGVASVVTVDTTTGTYEELISFFEGFLVIVEAFLVALLVLVAFNATSLNVDERTREHATMLAMGLPLRKVVRTIVVENVLLGLAGAAVGLLGGVALLWWLARVALDQSLPDVDLVLSVPPTTALVSLGVAVVAVAVTPFLLIGRIRRLDLPSSLRVVE
jgi:putative ABC transport system permease protein